MVRLLLILSALADLVAVTVTGIWVVSGFMEGLPFAILFALGSIMFLVAVVRQGRAAILVAIFATFIAEFEPIGAIVTSSILHQPAGVGALVPLIGGVLSIVLGAVVFLRHYRTEQAKPH